MITIQKGVPLPKRANNKYPFQEMEVGDSFELPVSQKAAVARSAWSRGLELEAKFTVRQISDETVRVWRIE